MLNSIRNESSFQVVDPRPSKPFFLADSEIEAATSEIDTPNRHVSVFDASLPGTQPVSP